MFSRLFRRVARNLANTRVCAGPPDTRLYAVGDVHGRRDLLDELLGRIREDIGARPVQTAAVVFLGDLVDRGPDSAGVIGRLLDLDEYPARRLYLLGNHEEVLLRVLAGEAELAYDWLEFGGDAFAESYGIAPAMLRALDEKRIAAVLRETVPQAHLDFIRSFGDTFRFGDYLLVHAGIRPGVPVEEQQPGDLRWIREPFLSDAQDHGCKVIHGHTITDGVDRRGNRIGIDTGAYRTGILTAAVVEGTDLHFLSTGR